MSPEKLPPSYQEAYAACLQLAGTKKAHVGFMQENDAVQTTINNRLAHFVEKGNDEEAQQLFEQYKDTLTDRDKEDIYMMIKNTLFSKDIPTVERSFNALHTNQDWSDYLKLSCMKVKTFYQSKQHINQAKTYIHDYFNTSITLDDVAFEVDLSPNYFSHLFKQEFGMTFIDYLTHVRLEKAKGLLEENKLTLKEIGYMVGYKDPNYFSRVFKKHYDESPKHFQRAIFKK